jgi:glutamyl-tRNA(Gln) amidotransferase subunit E
LFLKNIESKVIVNAFNKKKKAFVFKLENFKGIFGFEIQPNRRIGTEIASILKATTTLKGIFHSDELPAYGITDNVVLKVNEVLNIKENDSFFIVLCDSNEIAMVKELIENRLNELLIGVPEETRMATIEGNTEYQRPLSGVARMYPETDLSKIVFSKNFLENADKEIPLSIKEREKLYTNTFKLNGQLSNKMKLNNFAPIFEKVVQQNDVNPTTVAVFLLEDLVRAHRSSMIDLDDVTDNKLIDFFSNDLSKIPKSKIMDLFVYFINENKSVLQSIKELNLNSINNINLEKIVKEVIDENRDKVIELKERSKGLLMGRVMAKTKGFASGNDVSKQVSIELCIFLENL